MNPKDKIRFKQDRLLILFKTISSVHRQIFGELWAEESLANFLARPSLVGLALARTKQALNPQMYNERERHNTNSNHISKHRASHVLTHQQMHMEATWLT